VPARKSEQLAWGVIGYKSVEEGREWGKLSREKLHELYCKTSMIRMIK